MAQSSVTLFGVVDAAVQYTNGDGNGNVTKLVSGSNATSRIGFRGVEDLGGGLKAGFHLEGGLTVDDGTAAGLNFQRRSTISLMGNFGEVRVGRDYTTTFNNIAAYDPFGYVGVGAIAAFHGKGVLADATAVRTSNAISYFLPSNLGGFFGQAQYAFGETASNVAAPAGSSDNNHMGIRVGYANGPLTVSGAYSVTKAKAAGDLTVYGIGAGYDFGVAKAMLQYNKEERDAIATRGTASNNFYQLSVTAPVGAGLVKASYARADQNAAAGNNDADLWSVGYVYDLSKRTAAYGTYSRIDNKNASTLYNNGRATTQLGGSTSGLEVGVRHSF